VPCDRAERFVSAVQVPAVPYSQVEHMYCVAACVKSSAIGAVEADCRCDLGRMTSRSCRIEMLGS